MSRWIYKGGSWHIVCVYTCRTFLNGVGELISRSKPCKRSSSPRKEYRHSCDAVLTTYVTTSCEKLSRSVLGDFFLATLIGAFLDLWRSMHLILPRSYDCYFSKYICIRIYHTTSATFPHPEKLVTFRRAYSEIQTNSDYIYHLLMDFASLFYVDFLRSWSSPLLKA